MKIFKRVMLGLAALAVILPFTLFFLSPAPVLAADGDYTPSKFWDNSNTLYTFKGLSNGSQEVVVSNGGMEFIFAGGETDKAAEARKRIQNSLIGLVIAVAAAAIVSFIGRAIA